MCLTWNYTYQNANRVTLGIKKGGKEDKYVGMVGTLTIFFSVYFFFCIVLQ